MKPLQVIISAIATLTLILVLVIVGAYYLLNKPLGETGNMNVLHVPKASNLHKVSIELGHSGKIPSSKLLIIFARLTDQTQVQTGDYQLTADMTSIQLLNNLNRGKVIQHNVTIAEGIRFSDMRRILESDSRLNADTLSLNEQQLKRLLGFDKAHFEGWFYPDTYRFSANTNVSTLLKMAHNQTEKVLAEQWQKRRLNTPLKTPYEALILASIIEKETAVAVERNKIAGVFVRRLELNMRLQTDPTVIYAMQDTYGGDIRRKDLKMDSPYNTYRYKGLPPTPIALVGKESIAAALNPEDGDSLYFVARGDGSSQFSATLEQHNKAVFQYQINRKSNYRSTPKAEKLKNASYDQRN